MNDPAEFGRLRTLIDAVCNRTATSDELTELEAVLTSSAAAREFYVDLLALDAELHWSIDTRQADRAAEQAKGWRLENEAAGWRLEAGGKEVSDTLARRASEGVSPSKLTRSVSEGLEPGVTQGDSPPFAPQTNITVGSQKLGQSPFRISALAAIVAFIAAGILAYTFWPGPAAPPVVTVAGPAAKIANVTDAKWTGADSHAGDTLTTGQRLVLQSGSVEITFNSQARVVVEGPAELTIVDVAACRLATGRLTAHVPDPAKGFQVHTPSGTVTDLGTEFGVYVNTGAEDPLPADALLEQPVAGGPQFDGQQPPVTEVHVFKGKVDVAPGDQLAQAAGENPPPKSEIRNQKSEILSAGQAVTISANKVQPLPAADPFKFALDKLQGKPRQVLLSEDFETYDVGNQLPAIGPWIVRSGTRKGQGIHVYDPRAQIVAMSNGEGGKPVPNISPPPPVGARVAYIAAGAQNPRDTFPVLAREIDGKLLAKNCQVLVEFDYLPFGHGIQFSLAFAGEVGHPSGIELSRDVDAAKKVDCPGYQWYRLRLLLDVADGVVRDVRAERWHWLSAEGWVRDLTFRPAAPKLDWSTPPRYAMFGFPVVSPSTPAGNFWLDNVRIEVISE